jgi:hypothetical protein
MRPGFALGPWCCSLVLSTSLAACDAGAPPYADEVTAWASSARYRVQQQGECPRIEERHFGATRSVCWSAKSTVEQSPPGSRMFPRVDITIASYTSVAAAQARMSTFRFVPESIGPAEKSYPLRAGFRIGSRVVIVTTDAFAFQADAERIARELERATGGTDLTCWQTCRG